MDHFCYLCFVFVMLLVCSLQPSDHPLEKGSHLGSLVCFYYFPVWCPRSGVVLDFIDF